MADDRVIAVVGATGAQGGGLVRAILDDPQGGFAARALTRDPESPAARALAEAGAEVVRADIDDPASVEAAFAGAWGAYCVTFFWNHMSVEREMAEAETLAEAARKTGLRHAVWSTLEDTRRRVPLDDDRMPTLQGKYKVPHFDGKGASDHFFADRGVPTTYLLTTYYWDNLVGFGMGPKRGEDGRLAFVLPMGEKKLPGIAAEDIGRCAYGVFRRGDELVGKRVGIAGEHVSGAEMAAILGRALGEEVVHVSPPFDAYRGFGFPGADDLGNMFQFYHDFNDEFRTSRDVEQARALNPRLQDFATWAAANAGKMELG